MASKAFALPVTTDAQLLDSFRDTDPLSLSA
jgi:hypothetical protein